MRRFDNKEIWRRVDEVLFYLWDPIGISPEPNARAEYENYVPKIVGLIERGAKSQEIAAELKSIISECMGLTPDEARCLSIAELLLQHHKAIKDGRA